MSVTVAADLTPAFSLYVESLLCLLRWHEESHLHAFAIIPRVAKIARNPEVAHPALRAATSNFAGGSQRHLATDCHDCQPNMGSLSHKMVV